MRPLDDFDGDCALPETPLGLRWQVNPEGVVPPSRVPRPLILRRRVLRRHNRRPIRRTLGIPVPFWLVKKVPRLSGGNTLLNLCESDPPVDSNMLRLTSLG